MNYKIIQDEEALNAFIDWLPELRDSESYYITLFARKKYNDIDSNLTADKNQLKRVTSTKDRIIEKIRQMECAVGTYSYKGMAINQNNLALYISPNPRDFRKASLMLAKAIINNIDKPDVIHNPQSLAMNCIQVSHGRKIFFDLDVDFNTEKDSNQCVESFKEEIVKILNPEAVNMVRTNGGIHCLIALDKIHPNYNRTWFQNVEKNKKNQFFEITIPKKSDKDKNLNADEDEQDNGIDTLIPLVGCNQGANNFSPYMLYL